MLDPEYKGCSLVCSPFTMFTAVAKHTQPWGRWALDVRQSRFANPCSLGWSCPLRRGSAALWQQGLLLYLHLAVIQQSWSGFSFLLWTRLWTRLQVAFLFSSYEGHSSESWRNSLEIPSFSYPVKKANWSQYLSYECLWLYGGTYSLLGYNGPYVSEYWYNPVCLLSNGFAYFPVLSFICMFRWNSLLSVGFNRTENWLTWKRTVLECSHTEI